VSWICISLILGYVGQQTLCCANKRVTDKLVLLDQVVTSLDHDVVFVTEDSGDPVSNPLLHQVDVDFLDVDLLVKLGWELCRLEALLVDAKRHSEN
jgi:hypothetical protein